MIGSFYNAKSGVLANEKSVEVIANNIANVNTVGFKGSRVNFSDTLYTSMVAAGENPEDPLKNGNGSKVQQIGLVFEQGALNNTGQQLDFAITGDGFFALQNMQGDIYYSRAGAFQISLEGDNAYLIDTKGNRVLDQQRNVIELDLEEDYSVQNINLGIFEFSNQYGLQAMGSNLYAETINSGTSYDSNQDKIKQGFLEGAGVDYATEMARLIESQRAFQINARMIQLSDELEQTLNNLSK